MSWPAMEQIGGGRDGIPHAFQLVARSTPSRPRGPRDRAGSRTEPGDDGFARGAAADDGDGHLQVPTGSARGRGRSGNARKPRSDLVPTPSRGEVAPGHAPGTTHAPGARSAIRRWRSGAGAIRHRELRSGAGRRRLTHVEVTIATVEGRGRRTPQPRRRPRGGGHRMNRRCVSASPATKTMDTPSKTGAAQSDSARARSVRMPIPRLREVPHHCGRDGLVRSGVRAPRRRERQSGPAAMPQPRAFGRPCARRRPPGAARDAEVRADER